MSGGVGVGAGVYSTHCLVLEAIFTQHKQRIRKFYLTRPGMEKTQSLFLSLFVGPPAAVTHAAAPPQGSGIYIILFHQCHHHHHSFQT